MSQLKDVNTDDIHDAIRQGCKVMQSVFNADDMNVPFFDVVAWPDAKMDFSGSYSEAHVPGRHLNGLLNAQDTVDVDIDEEAVEKHARATFLSYSGPVMLPMNRSEASGTLVNFAPHNVREGFHALYALAKYRGSEKAKSVAEASISEILRYWDPMRGWDFAGLEQSHEVKCRRDEFIRGIARAIGPLVKYYRSTDYQPALELATNLKDIATQGFFGTDGMYDGDRFGHHTHSTTSVLSSLAQLADLTNDATLMGKVKAFYDNGLHDIRNALGWVIESSRSDAIPDRGEVNNSGDILETALILGRWGHTECFGDAELILRSHILPSQLRDNGFIRRERNPGNLDGRRDVANRIRGAFGFPAPYGHMPVGIPSVKFNLDIVGGAVGSLCEALREATTANEDGHRVNMLFDIETPDISVESPYTHSAMRVMLKTPGPLRVRIPSWLDAGNMVVDGTEWDGQCLNGYALISDPPLENWISFSFPLPKSEVVLRHRKHDIRVRFEGDKVSGMDNFGTDLTFFDPFE